MAMPTSSNRDEAKGLILTGIDGGNPLGFLAAIGAATLAHALYPAMRWGWRQAAGSWQPVLQGCGSDPNQFASKVHDALKSLPMAAFEINKKLPFAAGHLVRALRAAQQCASSCHRREADLLASFGTEMYPDKKGDFQSSSFRMVRSGDSAGQGLPAYAKVIRESTNLTHIEHALFGSWDYQDSGFSLRWDPVEDQRYALRWRDPSKARASDDLSTMLGANSLAIEALQWFPTVAVGVRARTSGFHRLGPRENFFVWPIWMTMIGMESVRSILTLRGLGEEPLPREQLDAMGIVEVYRSQRIQQNQYYSNFAPARPA